MIKVGDIVGRKSYGCDIVFKVTRINERQGLAQLKGLSTRLEATAPLQDLVRISRDDWERRRLQHNEDTKQKEKVLLKNSGHQQERATRDARDAAWELYRGIILHLDGDKAYVDECRHFYDELGLSAKCIYVAEATQPNVVAELCQKYRPDIVVLTGHDGKQKSKAEKDNLSLYHTSQDFCKSVQQLRLLRPDRDDLAIIAGACQSHYDALMSCGANFASSPGRILIDIFDPCIVAAHMATLAVHDYLLPQRAAEATKSGIKGVGGLESKGRARVLYPGFKWEGEVW